MIDSNINSVAAGAEGWQLEIWRYANKRLGFEVGGILTENHRMYLEEFAIAFSYHVSWWQNQAVFSPVA